jgi:hypothetical protein
VSGFLRNIARRAAGLPAESTVAPALPPAILLEPPALRESAAPAPVAAPAAAALPAVSQASAPVVQRRAAPAPAPAAPAAPTVAPPAAPGPAPMHDSVAAVVAPRVAPSPTVTQDLIAPEPKEAPPGPITVEVQAPATAPMVAETAVAPQPRPQADLPPAAIEQPTTIKRLNDLEVKPAAPVATAAPAPRPVEPARTEPRPEISPVVEKSTRETVLQEIIERIYATEPAAPAPRIAKPAGVPEPDRRPQPRSAEVRQPEPPPQTPQQRAEQRENGARAIAAPPEKRTVNVRIGSMELKLSPPPPSAPAAPEPASGFEEFDEVRSYRF